MGFALTILTAVIVALLVALNFTLIVSVLLDHSFSYNRESFSSLFKSVGNFLKKTMGVFSNKFKF